MTDYYYPVSWHFQIWLDDLLVIALGSIFHAHVSDLCPSKTGVYAIYAYSDNLLHLLCLSLLQYPVILRRWVEDWALNRLIWAFLNKSEDTVSLLTSQSMLHTFFIAMTSEYLTLLLLNTTCADLAKSVDPARKLPKPTDLPCLCKQCRSRSVGFGRSQLIWICTVCH